MVTIKFISLTTRPLQTQPKHICDSYKPTLGMNEVCYLDLVLRFPFLVIPCKTIVWTALLSLFSFRYLQLRSGFQVCKLENIVPCDILTSELFSSFSTLYCYLQLAPVWFIGSEWCSLKIVVLKMGSVDPIGWLLGCTTSMTMAFREKEGERRSLHNILYEAASR